MKDKYHTKKVTLKVILDIFLFLMGLILSLWGTYKLIYGENYLYWFMVIIGLVICGYLIHEE